MLIETFYSKAMRVFCIFVEFLREMTKKNVMALLRNLLQISFLCPLPEMFRHINIVCHVMWWVSPPPSRVKSPTFTAIDPPDWIILHWSKGLISKTRYMKRPLSLGDSKQNMIILLTITVYRAHLVQKPVFDI